MVAVAAVSAASTGCSSPTPSAIRGAVETTGAALETTSDGRYAMGTVLEMTLVDTDPERAARRLELAFETVAALEARFTRFDPDSELSRLNRAAGTGAQPVSPSLQDILQRAVEYTDLTGGAFDVTVGPLVALWIEAAQRGSAPAAEELTEARARVGAHQLHIADGSVRLPSYGMSVDLGGIAKGYALDRVRESWGAVDAALLNFGQSSVLAVGVPPDAEGWRMAVRGVSGGVTGVVTLRDQAFSVSSTLGQWSEIDGVRYGHVIDPRSGQALQRAASASVVAPDATLAEALSTALVVLTPERGVSLVESLEDCEARIEDESGRVVATSGWLRTTRFEVWSEGTPSLPPDPGKTQPD